MHNMLIYNTLDVNVLLIIVKKRATLVKSGIHLLNFLSLGDTAEV